MTINFSSIINNISHALIIFLLSICIIFSYFLLLNYILLLVFTFSRSYSNTNIYSI